MINTTAVNNATDTEGYNYKTDILRVLLVIPVCLLGFTVNTIAIITLMKCKRMFASIKYFTLNLAVSDALNCVFLPLSILHYYIPCSLSWPFLSTFYTMSTVFPIILAIDRCISIVFAKTYDSFLSSDKIIKICITSWILSFGSSFSFIFGMKLNVTVYTEEDNCFQFLIDNPSFLYILQVLFGIFLFVVVSSSCLILREFKRLTRIHDVSQRPTHGFVNKWKKGTFAVLFIMGSFLLFNIPAMVFLLISFQVSLSVNTLGIFFYAGCLFRIFNNIVNPCIYVWRLRESRIRFLLLFCHWNEKLRSLGHNMNVKDVLGFTFDEFQNNTTRTTNPNTECMTYLDA